MIPQAPAIWNAAEILGLRWTTVESMWQMEMRKVNTASLRTMTLMAASVVLAALMVRESQAVVVDQQMDHSFSYAIPLSDPIFLPVGQEFVPTISTHVGVILPIDRLRLAGMPDPPTGDVTVTVLLREGAIDGTIVPGATVTRTFELPSIIPINGSRIAFHFVESVSLSIGDLYVIEAQSADRVMWRGGIRMSPIFGELYPLGRAIIAGIPDNEGRDLGFQTLVVPSPPSGIVVIACIGFCRLSACNCAERAAVGLHRDVDRADRIRWRRG